MDVYASLFSGCRPIFGSFFGLWYPPGLYRPLFAIGSAFDPMRQSDLVEPHDPSDVIFLPLYGWKVTIGSISSSRLVSSRLILYQSRPTVEVVVSVFRSKRITSSSCLRASKAIHMFLQNFHLQRTELSKCVQSSSLCIIPKKSHQISADFRIAISRVLDYELCMPISHAHIIMQSKSFVEGSTSKRKRKVMSNSCVRS